MKLSDTQRDILTAAAQHPDHLAYPPERLPAGARQKVAQALLKNDLVIAMHRSAYDAHAKWTIEGQEDAAPPHRRGAARHRHRAGPRRRHAHGADGRGGRHTAGRGGPGAESAQGATVAQDEVEPEEEEEDDRPRHERLGVDEALIYGPAEEWRQPGEDAAMLERALAERTPRGLKAAAAAVLAVWDDEANREGDMIGALNGPMQALRTALADKPARAPRDPGGRASLGGDEAGGGAGHAAPARGGDGRPGRRGHGLGRDTVRGFFAGLKKGHDVQVLERVRMVGPNKEGAKGSYTIYHLPA